MENAVAIFHDSFSSSLLTQPQWEVSWFSLWKPGRVPGDTTYGDVWTPDFSYQDLFLLKVHTPPPRIWQNYHLIWATLWWLQKLVLQVGKSHLWLCTHLSLQNLMNLFALRPQFSNASKKSWSFSFCSFPSSRDLSDDL